MKVKLKQDQYYVSVNEGNCFGKKGAIVNVDASFIKLIKGKYELVSEEKEKIKTKKPLEKMNKDELLDEAKVLGIEFSDEILETITKAQIMSAIQETQK